MRLLGHLGSKSMENEEYGSHTMILEVGRVRWEDGKFEVSLGSIVKAWLKHPNTKTPTGGS